MFSTLSKQVNKFLEKLNCSGNVIFAFLILVLICYSPRHFGIDFGSLFCAIFGGLGFLYRLKNKKRPHWTEILFGYLLLYSFVLFALTGFVNWHENAYYFLRLLRAVFFFYVFYFIYYKLSVSIHDFIRLLFVVFGIHFILVYLQYFPPIEWRIFFLKLNPIFDPSVNPAEFKETMLGGKRVKGAMMGFDGAGIIIAYVVALGLIVFKKSTYRMILILSGFFGVLITSRTGAVVFLGIAAFYFLNQFLNNRKIFWKEILGVGLVFAILTTLVFTLFRNSSFVTKTLQVSFEFVYSYQKTGHVKIESLNDTLRNHLIITKKDLNLFGSPQHQVADPSGKILSAGQSDCGYLQVLANFGIPNTLVVIAVHLFLMASIFLRKKTIFDMRFVILLMFMIAAIKGPYFFGRMTYDLILFIFFVESIEQKEEKDSEFSL